MKKLLKKVPYAHRVLICIFACVSILLVVFSISLYRSYSDISIGFIQEYNENLIDQIVHNYEMIDDTIVQLASYKYSQPSIVKLIYQENMNQFEKNSALKNLQTEISGYPMYHSVVIYNNQSKETQWLDIDEWQTDSIVANIYKGEKIPSMQPVPIEITNGNGSKELVFSYYMYDYVTEASVMNGVFVFNIETDWIRELVNETEIEELNLVIIDQEGKVVFDSSNNSTYNAYLEREYLPQVLEEENAGGGTANFESDLNGQKMLVTTRQLNKTGWTLICEQPFASSYSAFLRPLKWNTFLMLFILLICAFGGTILLSRYMYRPVHNLVLRAQDMSEDICSDRDEFGYLANVLYNNSSRFLVLEEMKSNISEIKRQNYFKLLLENGQIQEQEKDEEFRECVEFVSKGRFFAIMLKWKTGTGMQAVYKQWKHFAADYSEQYEFVPMESAEAVILVKEDTSVNVLREKFLQNYSEFQQRMLQEEHTVVSVFVTSYSPPEQLGQLNLQLQQIKKYELMYSGGCFLSDEIIRDNHDSVNAEYPISSANRLLGVLRNGEMEKTEECFDEFLSKILHNDVDDFRIALMRVALSVQNLYEEMSLYKKSSQHQTVCTMVKKITTVSSMGEVQECFTKLFRIVCEREDASAGVPGKYSALIRSVADYIQLSYSDVNLNLEKVAAVFKMSPNYIGRLFKEEMKTSVGNYIVSVRLNKSLALLNDTDYNIKSIIEQIGFINESSFYKQFKKQFGITPKEYRVNRILVDTVQEKEDGL